MERLPVTSEFVLQAALRHSTGPAEERLGVEFGQSFPGDYYQFLLNGAGMVTCFQTLQSGYVHSSGKESHLAVVRRESILHLSVK
jgi:hypothetical protein